MSRHSTPDLSRPWALLPDTLRQVMDFRASLAAGDSDARRRLLAYMDDEDDEETEYATVATSGRVAVIPIQGVLTPNGGGLMSFLFGGTSYNGIAAQLRAAAQDPDVDSIVLDIDSPGGTVELLDETCDVVREVAAAKPMVAAVNSLCASAAYYLASQAGEIVATKSGWTGSIGTYVPHTEYSAMEERIGVKTTLISAGKYKVEANDVEPLSDEGRAAIQSEIDLFYGWVLDAVARGRGTTAEAVRAGYGEGRCLVTPLAIEAGLVDRIGSIGDAITIAAGEDPLAPRAISLPPVRAGISSSPRGGDGTPEDAADRLLAARFLLSQ
jgi:signal peptide peptidase SppA